MKILLDTHLLLWGMTGNAKLSDRAKAYLQDTENLCYFSAASIWEIGLKRRNHPESIPMTPEEVRQFCLSSGLYALPVDASHAAAANELPPIHGDPFDRMLVAQSREEGMVLLTHDDKLPPYGDWVIAV